MQSLILIDVVGGLGEFATVSGVFLPSFLFLFLRLAYKVAPADESSPLYAY